VSWLAGVFAALSVYQTAVVTVGSRSL